MIIEFGGQAFKFEKEFKVTFPLSYGSRRLSVSITITALEDEEFLSHYNCGDVINEASQLMASADCHAEPAYRLAMEILIETEGKEAKESGTCTAVSCQQHAFLTMIQVLFMSGLVTSPKLRDDKDVKGG